MTGHHPWTVRALAVAAGTLIVTAGGTTAAPDSPMSLVEVATAAPVPSNTVQVGTQQRALTGTDVTRTTDALVMYTPARGATTGTNVYGFEAEVIDGKVTRIQDGVGNMAIPTNGFVLSGHGTSRSWLRANAVVGAPVYTAGQEPGGTTTPPPSGQHTVTASGQTRALTGTDVYRTKDALVRYTPTRGATTGTNQYGLEAAVVGGKVTAVSTAGNMAIPRDGVVLSGHGTSRTWLSSYAKVGAVVRFSDDTTTPPPEEPGPVTERRPDIRMRTLTGITIDSTQTPGVKRLEFPTVVVNLGDGPFEIQAERSSSTSTDWVGTQVVHLSDGSTVERETAAAFYYGADGHNHHHVRDLNGMEILNANGQRERIAEKHGFCFEDNTSYRTWPADGTNGAPSSPVYTAPEACGAGQPAATSVLFGLSVGWGDTYPATLPDQYIDITGLPNGRYRVQAVADQGNWFVEADESNNTSWADIHIQDDAVSVIETGGGA